MGDPVREWGNVSSVEESHEEWVGLLGLFVGVYACFCVHRGDLVITGCPFRESDDEPDFGCVRSVLLREMGRRGIACKTVIV